ncbi:MAG: cytochrome P450 [Deltaproteobacteria bacterium]|nr:cytochrome P450 [Deltaproteobacteria bacterium]MBW2361945.1 cytochrome P450 [Deltaproteobacteria bacterium]
MDFDPHALSAREDPYPLLRELRQKHPIFYSETRDMWVVSPYAGVRAVLRDAETFASGRGTVPTGFTSQKPMLITQDPPYHDHLRRAVRSTFAPRRVQTLEAFIRGVTRELLDAIDPKEESDLVSVFSDPLPVAVVTDLLGIGFEDRDEFKRHADVIIHAAANTSEGVDEAQQWIYDYVEGVLPEREKNPGEDLVSSLLHPADEETKLTPDELLGFCSLVLIAATETTTNGLCNAVYLLHAHPELRRQLVADPSRMPGAVEEFLRLESPVHGLSRVTTRDVEFMGEKIEEGSRIHMLFAAANRDEEIFSEPDTIRPERSPNPHLAFGLGVHFCLGSSLARLELRIALQELLARFPNYDLVRERWERLESDAARGFARLPIRPDPR